MIQRWKGTHMHLARGWLVVVLVGGTFIGAAARGDDLADAREALTKHGLRAIKAGVLLPAESDLAKELGKSTLLRKNLTLAVKEQQTLESQVLALQKTLTALRQQHVQLSAQLANVNPDDVSTNNRIVGALNAIGGQFELLQDKQKEMEEAQNQARAKVNNARE